jgi:hypothetical protein
MNTNHRTLWSIYRTQFANAPELQRLVIPPVQRKRRPSAALSATGVERAVRAMEYTAPVRSR